MMKELRQDPDLMEHRKCNAYSSILAAAVVGKGLQQSPLHKQNEDTTSLSVNRAALAVKGLLQHPDSPCKTTNM